MKTNQHQRERKFLPRHRTLVLSGAAVMAFAAVANAQVTYEVTDLGLLPGGTQSAATAINEQGVVVGYADTPSQWQRAFKWENGVITALDVDVDSTRSWTNDINDDGIIVGVIMNGDSEQMATVWENGAPQSLGTLGGVQSASMGIDESGRVVGWAMYSPDPGTRRWHPFVYENNVMKDLGPVPVGTWNGASAISENGQHIVGDGQASRRTPQVVAPIIYDDTNGPFVLGTLGGLHSYTTAVNNDGWVVGSSRTGVTNNSNAFYLEHAFLYADERMIDLGVVFGNMSRAYAVSNLGVIVGTCWDSNIIPWDKRAFVRFDNEMIDLNTLIDPGSDWTILEAFDVNDQGQIVGVGRIGDAQHAVLLTPQ